MEKITQAPIGEFSRRSFLKGGVVVGAAAMLGSLASCSPAEQENGTDEGIESASEADPIPPLDPPNQWDEETDIVVVGTGGGGLAATLMATDKGASVIAVEKGTVTGGATAHAARISIRGGGSRDQNELQYALPSWPFDPDEVIKSILPNYQMSLDDKLLREVVVDAGPCIDWMQDHGAPLVSDGSGGFFAEAVANGSQNNVLGEKTITDYMQKAAEDAGAIFRLETACDGLVVEGDRVVGIKTKGMSNGEETYIKAIKGVILCSGGFGMNRDMLAKYCPSAMNAASGGPMPSHTGECTRMAIGAGADIAGFNSWSAWDGGLVMPTDGSADWWQYLHGGSNQLTRNPWLQIDIKGDRVPFYGTGFDNPRFNGGTGAQAAHQMSRIGGRSYVIFDSDYETNIFKFNQIADRNPITPDEPMVEQSLAPSDWRDGVNNALEQGFIKQADTIEELEELLGFRSGVLVKAVDRWNELCANGKDTDLLYPYPPEWMIPIAKPPYFGAAIGAQIGKTYAGVRVSPKMEVMRADGSIIDGLYACATTAGGFNGESSYSGCLINSSVCGGSGLSWVTGYMAGKNAASA